MLGTTASAMVARCRDRRGPTRWVRPFPAGDELVRAALMKLSPDHREIIDLVYYHEKSAC